jgi:hypothetical protein
VPIALVDLAQVPERLDGALLKRTGEEAGFTIEVTDRVASEWLESVLEGEDGEKRLLLHDRQARRSCLRDPGVAGATGCR